MAANHWCLPPVGRTGEDRANSTCRHRPPIGQAPTTLNAADVVALGVFEHPRGHRATAFPADNLEQQMHHGKLGALLAFGLPISNLLFLG